ncbi:hypothetical protein FKP32DRAFT_1389033 [Trametes sanguinea]|nr:hypothetical protein FKP32DRAFT_1389033 [Trametes sanguinea]
MRPRLSDLETPQATHPQSHEITHYGNDRDTNVGSTTLYVPVASKVQSLVPSRYSYQREQGYPRLATTAGRSGSVPTRPHTFAIPENGAREATAGELAIAETAAVGAQYDTARATRREERVFPVQRAARACHSRADSLGAAPACGGCARRRDVAPEIPRCPGYGSWGGREGKG